MIKNPLRNSRGGEITKNKNGVFLVIEGTDGSGKGTQFQLLRDYLQKEGYEVETFDFPQYDRESSYFIKKYLNGEYGDVNEVGPYTSSLFFALDRYEAGPSIKEALKNGRIVLANRFTGSNMAHQGTKFTNDEQRRGYFVWLDNLEYQMLGIPRPDKNIVLRVPADIAQTLVSKKQKREYTQKRRDIHEANLDHLKLSVQVYDDLCRLFPKDFLPIDCARNDRVLSIHDIHVLIKNAVNPILPPVKHTQSVPQTQGGQNSTHTKYLLKTDAGITITDAGREFLKQAVTNLESDVYAFTNQVVSPITTAAAMARLSRRGDDMRITILDEFAEEFDKDSQLLHRVITAYGDDSVQQLVGTHVVVENASNLLTKKLEWGRLASYLEQSTRYIYFDQKDKNGKYKYFTPSQFDAKTTSLFNASMDTIFDEYSNMVHQLTDYVRQKSSTPQSEQDVAWKGATRAQACDAVRSVLPVATKSTVGIFASGQALESLIMHLQSDDLLEMQSTGEKILSESRSVIPAFLERADKPDRGGAIIAYLSNTKKVVRSLSKKYLTETHGKPAQPVTLTDFWPKNELDLIADMLYEHSNLPLASIRKEVDSWPYAKKIEVFRSYMGDRLNRRHKPGRALEKAHYSWDILCDYGIFRDLQRHRMVDDLEWQLLTPRYGYEIPKIVEEAGLTDRFEKCFEISLRLYSHLQEAGYELEAQYATLLGHKMRWKITYNAREAFHLHELRTSPQGHPSYRKLVNEMHKKLTEIHPLLADAMNFVNKGEDPELTRLAAEKYTQFKLQSLT